MGLYDIVRLPCPRCGEIFEAQSKGGNCILSDYELEECPQNVLLDVNRNAPFICPKCDSIFEVELRTTAKLILLEHQTFSLVQKQLSIIRSWNGDDFRGLVRFIKPMWEVGDFQGYVGDFWDYGSSISITTGNLDKNNSIIEAMKSNGAWWKRYWVRSNRDGRHEFIDENKD
jgi:hypothetical protein